jgi:hypothetical protein
MRVIKTFILIFCSFVFAQSQSIEQLHQMYVNAQTVKVASVVVAPSIVDSYSESYRTTDLQMTAASNGYNGQCFTGNGYNITSAKFYLTRSGTVTGSMYALLYAVTGTYGNNATPTGSVLVTSDAVNASTVGTNQSLITFTFSTPYRMVNGTKYFIILQANLGVSGNKILFGMDDATLSHGGNECRSADAVTWSPSSAWDVCFYVYGTP